MGVDCFGRDECVNLLAGSRAAAHPGAVFILVFFVCGTGPHGCRMVFGPHFRWFKRFTEQGVDGGLEEG